MAARIGPPAWAAIPVGLIGTADAGHVSPITRPDAVVKTIVAASDATT